MQLSLPEHKMQEVKALLWDWQGRKSVTKKEIQSLAGKLQHAVKVVRPGRCFAWHIYDLTSVRGGQNQRVRLNQQIRSNIQWWITFVDTWNGISLFWKLIFHPGHPSMVWCLWLKTSGFPSCGQTHCRSCPYRPQRAHANNDHRIRLGKVLGRESGTIHEWQPAVVTVLTKSFCYDTHLMGYLQCIVFCAARNNFWLRHNIHLP